MAFELISPIVEGTGSDDNLSAEFYTTTVRAGDGRDTLVLSGNYVDYSFSQSSAYGALITNINTTQQILLESVERLQFDDGVYFLNKGLSAGEFHVNSTVTYNQKYPSTTALADGGFVITWHSEHEDSDGDGTADSSGIYAQRYDSSGNKVGVEEFHVNSTVTYNQFYPSTTALADGGFVITWYSSHEDSDGDGTVDSYGIYAQRYDASGNKVGVEEFHVNSTVTSNQYSPSITALADGGFVITWHSYHEDSDGDGTADSSGIYAQRYDVDGTVNGSEFQVNTYTSNNQSNPSTTALADGGFVVTWTSDGQDGDSSGIYAQRYDVNGNTAGGEFQVNTYTTSYLQNSSITSLADGGFVVTWNGVGIYAQRYDANGNTAGDEFQVNTYTLSEQDFPSITALADGGFVVAWVSDMQDGDDIGIYAQRYDVNGNTVGAEFQVNTYTTSGQDFPSITALSDGGFVITWQSDGQDGGGAGIYAQRYDSSGEPLGVVTLDTTNIINGTVDDDFLLGFTDPDTITTGQGADLVLAYAGDDMINLTADGVWGAWYVAKNVDNNASVGTGEMAFLVGLNRFSDVIDGMDGDDRLELTSEADAFAIDDVYSDHHSFLVLSNTTQGIDSTARIIDLESISAGAGNDVIDLTSDNFVLATGVSIYGEAGNDTLWGSNGNDTINGGDDNDTINGGVGIDTLIGGAGADVFQFTATSGSDVIIDFDVLEDSIQLYYRAEDNHSNTDLNFTAGILTWNVDNTDNDVVIDVTASNTQSYNVADGILMDSVITFVEIIQISKH